MKFTFNWLKEFVSFDAAPEKLAELLTMAGLEVESVTALRQPESGQADWLFEVAVTPNRGDCLGFAGLAREVAALTGGRTKVLSVSARKKESSLARHIAIEIENPRLCPRYSARIIEQVRIGPSPDWLRFRLESCGIRAINNVVDITNYVMLETGQPLHAFDLERLPERRIVVRAAGEQRKFTTLDGIERELWADDLLICAGDLPVALAGIMGGMDSEVRAETRSVLLESANFDPTAIRRTAKRLALHSEASHRFERGVDPDGTVAALYRAVDLLDRLAGGLPLTGVADRYPRKPKAAAIALREERIEQLLGLRIEAGRAEKLLKALGLNARRQARRKIIQVTPSARRPDLSREVDLIEEIARLHGYEKIPTSLPRLRSGGAGSDLRLAWERRVRAFLAGEGLVEVVNLPFTSERLNRSFPGLWEKDSPAVALLNPLAKENAAMRLSLIPGLIENLRLNLAQRAESFHAYHLAKVFRLGAGGEPEERQSLAGLIYGPRARRGLRLGAAEEPGFLACKGLVEGLWALLHVEAPPAWTVEASGFLHPGRAAALHASARKLGYLGQMHPDFCEEFGLPPFLIFDLDFDGLLQYAPRRLAFRSLPRFPSVERDFAVVVDHAFPSQRIIDWIANRGEALIEAATVFDQYLGAPIPEGKKSLAYKISYRADERTLTDTEINALHQKLVDQIGQLFGAQLRS